MKRIQRRKFANHKKRIMFYSIFFMLFFISIGYAYLSASLSINGNTTIAANTWDIHFANLSITNGSVTASTPAAIQTDTTNISYSVELASPGDFYEFEVDVVNAGTIPGKISLANIQGISSSAEPYLEQSIKYTNGNPVQVDDLLNPSSSKRIVVRIAYKEDFNSLPEDDIELDLELDITYTQTDEEEEITTDTIIQELIAENSSCFTKYEGQVTDQVGETVTATNVYFNKCADKRNIIFNNMCWQMIRTTETGGIKMIYNGEAVNGKCEVTRGAHKGIVQIKDTNQVLNSSYLYGSSFTYDINTNEFTLTDTTTATWSDSTFEDLIGKYTCRSVNNSCTTLYHIGGYYSNTTAYSSSYIIDDVGYSLIGKSSFNSNSSSPAMVGYMFNRVTDTGNGIDDLISAVDVNKYNSSIKGIIDNWYAKNLSSKTYMLEDIVYCNDRSLDEFSNLDFGDLLFRGMNTNVVMDCVNITDQFAVSNNSAKLTYPVAIFTMGEINNISNDIPVYIEGQSWWSITPAYFNKTAQNHQVGEWRTNVDENGGIRPAISLATTTRILSGTGLETDPWIVDES